MQYWIVLFLLIFILRAHWNVYFSFIESIQQYLFVCEVTELDCWNKIITIVKRILEVLSLKSFCSRRGQVSSVSAY